MNKATLERIMNPGVKWIVYLYVIPHYPHVMYYVGISSNSTKKRREKIPPLFFYQREANRLDNIKQRC